MISRSLALPLGVSHLPKGILEVIFLNAPICSRRIYVYVTYTKLQFPIQLPDLSLTIFSFRLQHSVAPRLDSHSRQNTIESPFRNGLRPLVNS